MSRNARPRIKCVATWPAFIPACGGKSGIEGDTMYPVMEYDWTSISLGSIRKLIGGSFRNPWFFRNDKIIIFRKLSLLQGVLFRMLYAGVKLRDLIAARATVSKASKELISC